MFQLQGVGILTRRYMYYDLSKTWLIKTEDTCKLVRVS